MTSAPPPGGWQPPSAVPPPPPATHPAYGGPAYGGAPGPGARPPVDAAGHRYHELLRLGRRPAWAWALLGVLAGGIGFFFVQLAAAVPTVVWWLVQGVPSGEFESRLSGDPATPGFFLLINLGWAFTIPLVMAVVWGIHGLRPRFAASVRPGIRWTWFAVSLGLAAVALVATVLVGALVPAGETSDVGGAVNDFTSELRDFLIIMVLLTPLQAAGEEYLFRGYLTQLIGGVLPWERLRLVVAVVVPAVVFALAHGVQEPPIFVDRLAFGLVAGVLVIATGGLEASIAMHVLNNLLAFSLAILFGDMTEAFNPEGSTWWQLVPTLTQSFVFLGLCLFVGRRMGVAHRTAGDVLERSRGRV
ncbi:MAG: CPBP family intramembrane metalloprotease domain-containing protein [Nocardioides sp.]|nr:CPBP family intramembrane metalloprotease domain-containing protein [Nocardioides sp.]